jgi:hypothetical protein
MPASAKCTFTVAFDKASFFLFLTIPVNVAVVTWEKRVVVLKIVKVADSIDRLSSLRIAIDFGIKR